ncbi:segregation/condensation protein A [Candidatus Wolfebacteria bacterium]|nr:segregation/condensation protein A [Candidatus Wolfebacteria bacterium]
MIENTFRVKTEVFEGPLELLLELIERRRLHINDISLAAVAADYINHIKELSTFPTHDAAHFVLIASTLLLIKSKSLLPAFSLSPEEQADIYELERRLELYKRIRLLSRHVRERFGAAPLFPREESKNIQPVFTPDPTLTLQNIHTSIRVLIQTLPKAERLSRVVVDKVISLEKMIERLTERIKSSIKMNFKKFTQNDEEGKVEKVNVIVSFLAMLELVKQGVIAVEQSRTFADIEMEARESSVPNYS